MQILPLRWQQWMTEQVYPRLRAGEPPLRAELFGVEQLDRHARNLAASHQVDAQCRSSQLLEQLEDNEAIIRNFNRETLAVHQTRRVTPAAEWLLDNFYLIEDQIQLARRHLPREYSRELPCLLSGPSADLPRVYDLVLELIAHVDAQIDAGPLSVFVKAYQTVTSLKLGELWAVPIMLRLGLIENLQRIATRLTAARRDRDLADLWAERLQDTAEKSPADIIIVVADMAKSGLPVTSSFVAEFTQRLSRQNPVLHLARNWLEQRLAEQGLSIERLVHQESQNQAADQVSVSYSISSLRFLGVMDWKGFVESLSQVEQILRTDPADVYQQMEFSTRDQYRHAVESIARYSRMTEADVAHAAIKLAGACVAKKGQAARAAHVGFYLIDKGRPELERAVNVEWPWTMWLERGCRRFPLTFYIGSIVLLTLGGTAWFVRQDMWLEMEAARRVFFALTFLVCASQLAVAVMNWLTMLVVKPRLLPRLDFSAGIEAESRTMVVVPTLLTDAAGVDRLIETLEIHYLANRDEYLHFALLTDFADASQETMPGDDALLQRAKTGIKMLTDRYAPARRDRFFLLHRPRLWNEGEKLWMGYERKRGKLAQFNALLRGGPRQSFSAIVGAVEILPSVKYVITLDTDTQLPRDAARTLVGIIAHPLNRAEFDPDRGVVTEGYGILQPRVGVSLPSAGRSWFVRLFAGEAGIDPYTRAVSDVYQDLFREGSFIGKGIYDVDAFERALKGRFPENTVLSHDLLESCHARSALVSDVELYEEHPSRYNVDINRRHRWIRGDWQITQWLLSRVPGHDARRIQNPLSNLSQWKIFDNLRRSLVPTALLLLLLGGWFLSRGWGAAYEGLVLVLIALPGLAAAATEVFRRPKDLSWTSHLRSVARSVGRQFGQILMTAVFLPYDAFVSFDAIARTLVRLIFTRRRLLEWQTSSESARTAATDLVGFFATMWIAPVISLIAGLLLVRYQPGELPAALPLLGLWLAAPWIAWWISRPIETEESELAAEDLAFLRRMARKTWHFFESFVNERENGIPPDNFQEIPVPIIASRTSPTNLGLALLANLGALDLGYLGTGGLIRRTESAFAAMERLERYRGHFFNWYDTRTLQPLAPRYISSVDSGNLAAHLLTLGAGFQELEGEKIFLPRTFHGLRDTARILGELTGPNESLSRLEQELEKLPSTLRTAHGLLKRVVELAEQVAASLAGREPEIKDWAQTLSRNCRDHFEDLVFLAPWLSGTDRFPFPPGELGERVAALDEAPTLKELAKMDQQLCPLIDAMRLAMPVASEGAARDDRKWLEEFSAALRLAGEHARQRLAKWDELRRKCDELAVMDFEFLYDPARELFSIGFNVTDRRRDVSCYDLLASEARLGSYVAIAQGQVGQDHWFSLGRLLVAPGGDPILVSWSGSMFEYLMPLLVMPNYENSLLAHTCKVAVDQQIAYGATRGVPWGISESGYHRTDARMNYQYRAFGVPGLGLKRGLADDLVIAPYASALALMVAPREACENLRRLAIEGREGAYGFYEAIDYTPSRLPPEETSATIRSYMAHHQGMSLLSFVNVLCDQPMPRRFMACPLLKATDLLLQERVPKVAANVFSGDLEMEESGTLDGEGESPMRIITNPSQPVPEIHLLSNGRYHVVVSSAGGGWSRWHGLAVTRWREDATCDSWGTFVYLRDVATGRFWSATYQPTVRATKSYEAIFTQARAEFRQQQGDLEIHKEICVSPEDDVELRRITLTNRSSVSRTIELTSYAEVVLAALAADETHPAFSNLFVQTEFLPGSSGIICTRRPRSHDEKPPWLLHLMLGQGELGEISCETDRAQFIGRGGTLAQPAAMKSVKPLSNTEGSVLDPIIALRRTVTLPPNGTAVIDVVIGVGESREMAVALMDKYQSHRMADRAFDLAWTHSQVALHQLAISEPEAQHYGRLASALVYSDPVRRAAPAVLRSNRRGQSGLWSYGISGDIPIVVVRLSDPDRIEIARQMIQAHSYWRMKGLMVDLVFIVEDVSIYRQSLHEQIAVLLASGIEAQMLDRPGGIFVRRLEQIPHDDRGLLQAAARIFLNDENGTLMEQLQRRNIAEPTVAALVTSRGAVTDADAPEPAPAHQLLFANGLGGFTHDGREYVITLEAGRMTPAPWVNVLANPNFGTVISESGGAYTWFENAHEFRLTPWNNDPVQDTSGEAFYIRDEQSGQFWSPTPLPARGSTPYVVRHGFGYTVFEHTENGIKSELWIYVATDAPVKLAILKLQNISGRPRRLSATGYWEWVLGDVRRKSLLHVQTEVDLKTGALLAYNNYNTEFPERIAFLDVNDPTCTLTGDRREFLGRNGSPAQPAALKRRRLSGRVGPGLDPCGALQVAFDLQEGQERETSFRLGVGRNLAEVQKLVARFRLAEAGRRSLEQVWEYWSRTLGMVNVETPDAAVNVLVNGWLLYQTLGCRLWGRTGFYQSGGAYGFRDQLQDVMALIHAEPALAREHLLRAASRQFREGDVQHWWHPPIGRGVRTHFSDDYLWLPYAVCRYIATTGDADIWDQKIAFLEGRQVKPEEEAYYDLPHHSEETATLYEHCTRAIERGLTHGSHGLPLIGCGDWNDGMNLVGRGGRGESVWLAFFLYDVLKGFSPLARTRGETVFADRCLAEALKLQQNIEQHAWDGQWYRRAFFDDGEPLGSAANQECQIDSLPQSWAAISGAGDPQRTRAALEAVAGRLVRERAGLIQLFDPPFDKSPTNPGYIKGYIPGVRENGGQYTHGAIWTIMAFALSGEVDRAWALFDLINPVNHGATAEKIATYKVEPYVVAADVYSLSPHTGRGGWTWYTGSAGWMYRLLVETLLGVNLQGNQLRLTPRLPRKWPSCKIHYRYRKTLYHIVISRTPVGASEKTALPGGGKEVSEMTVPLLDDGQEHVIEMVVR